MAVAGTEFVPGKVAAVVCAHDMARWDDLVAAIDSLTAQTRQPDEILIVVDNNADLVQRARPAFAGTAVVIDHQGARGVSNARNVGVADTACDIVAFLDDDAIADPEWLTRLLCRYSDDAVMGVGGFAAPRWDPDPGPEWFPSSFLWVVGCTNAGVEAEPHVTRNLIGCNMTIRRTAWDMVGGFAPHIGRVGQNASGGDETDFCVRVAAATGGHFVMVPDAAVTHRVPRSRQSVRYLVRRCWAEGRAKALIARRTEGPLLVTERRHLVRVIPTEACHAVRQGAFARFAAIALGTGATVAGWLTGLAKREA